MAGLTEVPVIVREMDDTITHQVRLVENLQREDLNPLEETEGILELLAIRLELEQSEVISYLTKMRNVCDRHKDSDEVRHNVMSQAETKVIEELFTSLGRMGWESFVKNRLPLFKLPPDVLEVLRQGKLEYTKARAMGIENSLHWILDVALDEDDCRIRKDNAPQNFAVLRHIAVNLLGNEKSKKLGIKNKQFLAAMDDNYLAKVLELNI